MLIQNKFTFVNISALASALQFPIGGDVSIILPVRSTAPFTAPHTQEPMRPKGGVPAVPAMPVETTS
jgi:hypothetical protein